jgi:pantetheine-phosphate adenylyltransferase
MNHIRENRDKGALRLLDEAKSEHQMNRIVRDICLDYLSHDQYFQIKSMYEKPDRHYHSWEHVLKVAKHIYDYKLSLEHEYELLIVAAFLHDAVYDTRSQTNEEDSADLVDQFTMSDEDKAIVRDIIIYTKYRKAPENKYQELFGRADLHIFDLSPVEQLDFEKKIFREYYWVPIPVYVENRIKILKHLKENFGCNVDFLVSYLETKEWHVGFMAGSFFPFTIGHKNVLDQALNMFDKIIVGFGRPEDKTSFAWDDEKYGVLNEWVKSNHETADITGLITDNIARMREYADVTLIRGLRNSTDLIYEQNYLQILKDITPDVKCAYFMTRPDIAHVSSSLVRSFLKLSPERAYNYYRIK